MCGVNEDTRAELPTAVTFKFWRTPEMPAFIRNKIFLHQLQGLRLFKYSKSDKFGFQRGNRMNLLSDVVQTSLLQSALNTKLWRPDA